MIINRTKNSITGAISGIISKFVTIIGSFTMQTLIIHILGVEYAGLNSLFSSVLTVLSLAELGLGSAIVYSMYAPIIQGDNDKICALLKFYRKTYNVIGLVVLGIGLLIMPFISFFVKGTYPADINLYILYSLYLFHTVSGFFPPAYMQSVPAAHQRRDVINWCLSVTRIIQYVFQVYFLLSSKNYYFYTAVFALSSVVMNLMIAQITKRLFPQYKPVGEIDSNQKQDIKKRVSALFGHELGGKIIISSDSIIISAILGVSVLGVYSNYYYIFSSVVAIFDIIRMSLVAGIGNKILLESKQEVQKFFRAINYIWIGVVSVASTCLLCGFQDVITIWVGKRYNLPLKTVIIIVLYFFFWQFRTIGLTIKDAAGLWKEDWIKPYAGIVVNIIGSVALTFLTGSIIGVLIPTIVIMIFIYFPIETGVIYRVVFGIEKKKEYLCSVMIMTAATMVSLMIAFSVCSLIAISNIFITLLIKLIISAVISLGVFLIATIRLPENKYAKDFLQGVKKRLFR